ncbi:MAG: ImmA/IrrE family metallo-endopeptidase [Eubacterium sp.]|nr:ImmA/IrrE family metallo-endopeptidase [Eubacterium sp.]
MHLNNYDAIIKKADLIVKRLGTRKPEQIAKELGIKIIGMQSEKLKGSYIVIKKNRYIFIKEDLDEVMRAIVILHEIGHDMLHRKEASMFKELSLFDMSKSRMEYEANLFAAHIMLPDEEMIGYIMEGYSVDQIAAMMNSDINLVALKAADLSRRGYSFRPQDYSSKFLKG